MRWWAIQASILAHQSTSQMYSLRTMSLCSVIPEPHASNTRSKHYVAKLGLKINTNKAKLFSIFPIPGAQWLSINGERIDYVPIFKYLRSIFLSNGRARDRDIAGTARVNHLRKFDEYCGRAVKSAFKQRFASFALESGAFSNMDAKPGRCELIIPGSWKYWVTVAHGQSFGRTGMNEIKWCYDTELLSVFLQCHWIRLFSHVLRRSYVGLFRQALCPASSSD